MVTIEKSITISAPPEDVFGFLEEPAHLPEIMPGMVEVKDVVALPQGGYRYHWRYWVAGVPFEGVAETQEFVPYQRIVDKVTGEFWSTFDWAFRKENGYTKVDLSFGYELPKQLKGKFPERFLVKLNEREAEAILANLKDRIEY